MVILVSWKQIAMNNEDVAALEELEEGHWWGEERTYRLIDLVEQYVPKKSRILEVGCGTGKILSLLNELDYECQGVEPSYTGYNLANNLSPGRIFNGTLIDFMNVKGKDQKFDCILLFDVLEHLENDQQDLNLIYKLVSQGGYVIFSVPADPALWSKLDEEVFHFRRYTIESISHLIANSGLKIIKITYWCSILKLPIKLYRKILNPSFVTNIKKPNHFINYLLSLVVKTERISWLGKVPGVSLFGVAQKSK